MDSTKKYTEVDHLADGSETVTDIWYDDVGQCWAETADGKKHPGGYKTGFEYANVTVSNPNALSSGTVSALSSGGGYTISSGTGGGGNWATATSGKMTLIGEDADLVINGRSLNDTLAKLEERLNILNVNEKLESEWSELKELGDRYRELEKHINDKMKTYEALKRYPKV